MIRVKYEPKIVIVRVEREWMEQFVPVIIVMTLDDSTVLSAQLHWTGRAYFGKDAARNAAVTQMEKMK